MFPDDRFYSRRHEWIRPEDGQIQIGVTAPILRKIGIVVGVELLDPDDELKLELPFGEIEGMNETHPLYPPIESRIIEVNEEVIWNHEKLMSDPYGEGWLVRLQLEDQRDLRRFMPAMLYAKFCKEALGKEFLDKDE